jgi:rfaE bifunctional protein nucleotidyltransferase chain/domain
MKLKGQSRPIIPAAERAEIVSALEDVDYVTIFAELTPIDIIAALQPDIHCKGGDYADNSSLPESDVVTNYGGQVRLLSFLSNHSTSKVIQNILKNYTSSGANVNTNSTDFSQMA